MHFFLILKWWWKRKSLDIILKQTIGRKYFLLQAESSKKGNSEIYKNNNTKVDMMVRTADEQLIFLI